MKIFFDHVDVEAPNIWTFYFRPEKTFNYVAGQYVELTLRHEGADNRGERRQFTLSSSPTDELLAVTNKFAPKDGSTYKRALANLKPGDELFVSKPRGSFALPEHPGTPVVFVAGGIGITPFRSMAAWVKATGEKRPIELFYGAKNEKEILFKEVFEDIVDKLTFVLSNPSASWKGERGYLAAERIMESNKIGPEGYVYLSGPEAMVTGIQEGLVARGVLPKQLVVDLWDTKP